MEKKATASSSWLVSKVSSYSVVLVVVSSHSRVNMAAPSSTILPPPITQSESAQAPTSRSKVTNSEWPEPTMRLKEVVFCQA